MNGLRYAAVAAALMMACSAAEAYDINGSSTIPSNVTAVYPEPDRRVSLAPTEYPLGVQHISIVFDRDVTVNTACTEQAHIYRDGEDEPFQSVGVSGASVDFLDFTVAGLLFPNNAP